jgi:hypothetical protein
MNPEVIFQIIVGLGMIGGMWRLTREVASLASTLKHYTERTQDHEIRLRVVEQEVARARP